ncbi:MAG: MFS transporter, partial [Nocardioidaceae bacterium]|nr:MFS transporter [Nocardioidaceae bacterium]
VQTLLQPWVRVALALTAIGWGANHFAGLLAVYRQAGQSEAFISFAVGVYAVGLVASLLVTAVVGDRIDHRAAIRFAVVVSAAGTALIAAGAQQDALIQVGRFVAGIGTGAALAPGTAWLMDLSRDQPLGTGPRRATIALTAGFGGGPFVAGLFGQWAPHAEVTPYLPHLVLSVLAAVLVWRAPVAPADRSGRDWRGVRRAVAAREFLRTVPATAPWVFGVVTTAFAIAPSVVKVQHLPVASGAAILGVVLLGGVLIQGPAKRMEERAMGRPLRAGMSVAALGAGLTALNFQLDQPLLLFVGALVLGAAYGLLLVGGLSRVESVSEPEDRSRVNAVFYAISYIGFALPYLFVLLTDDLIGPAPLMWIGAGVAVLTLVSLPRMPTDQQPRTRVRAR